MFLGMRSDPSDEAARFGRRALEAGIFKAKSEAR